MKKYDLNKTMISPIKNELLGKKTLRSPIEEEEYEQNKMKEFKLLKETNNNVNSNDKYNDNLSTKIRNIPHEEGSFASFIYFQVDKKSNKINTFQNQVKSIINKNILKEFMYETLSEDSYHISLSKTFYLKFHQIDQFLNCLKENIELLNSNNFCLCSKTKYFENEFKNRYFISIPIIKNKTFKVTIIYIIFNIILENR